MRNFGNLLIAFLGLCIAGVFLTGMLLPSSDLIKGFAAVVSIAFLIGILVLYIYSVISCYSDANRRGKPGWLVALFVALFSWPMGWLAWIIFRPNLPRMEIHSRNSWPGISR